MKSSRNRSGRKEAKKSGGKITVAARFGDAGFLLQVLTTKGNDRLAGMIASEISSRFAGSIMQKKMAARG